MLVAASLSAAVIPMIIYLIIIWLFDIYEREPFGLVIKNFLWGAVGAIFLAIFASAVLSAGLSFFISNRASLNNLETIIIAPFVEEITKGIFLLILFTNKKFDNITDGIVYGGAIGLGFGMTENFFYFLTFSSSLTEWAAVVVTRTLFSAVMHCVSTGIFGASLGYVKFNNSKFKIIYPLIGLTAAMSIHLFWNYSVSFKSTEAAGFIFMFFVIIFFIGIYILSILKEKKLIYSELLIEAEKGLIPFEHLKTITSSKRNKSGWVDEGIRKSYIRAAATLAFRKIQLKNSKDSNKILFENDVNHYRDIISGLLKKPLIN